MEKLNSDQIAVPNEETVAAMKEAEAMAKDKNTKKFSSVEKLFSDLNSDK